MVNNPAPAPAGFATKIRQNPAPVGFGKSKSGTTLNYIKSSAVTYQCTVQFINWLSTRQRILYELYTIVYKCIHGAAPSYPFATNTSRRYLRSATHGDLLVPRTKTVTYGPRSFAVSGLTIWNTLPTTLRVSATTLEQFQSGLKPILFRLAYGTWLGAFLTV